MKKIVVVNPSMTALQRERVEKKAASCGYQVFFFETNAGAMNEAADAEIIYALGKEIASAGKCVKWFCTTSAGVDIYCQPGVFHSEDVMLTNSTGAFGLTISEHIVMVTLMLLRRIPEYAEYIREKQWVQGLPVRSIYGSRVTILGTGNLGTEAARRFRGFMPAAVTGVNSSGHPANEAFTGVVPMERLCEVLPETDILVMCLPGTAKTYHVVDEKVLKALKRSAVVINVGRGNSVDEAALLKALNEGRVCAAALDVFEKEPLPQESPLWSHPKVLVTPHVSGNMSLPWTVEENVNMFLEDFENYVNGRPLKRLVDRNRGY